MTIRSDELEARVEELQTERVWRLATRLVLGAFLVIALAVAASIYVAYGG